MIVPTALVSQWVSEIKKCAPELKVTEYLEILETVDLPHSGYTVDHLEKSLVAFIQSVDIVISTYQMLKGKKRRGAKRKHCYLRQIHWRRVVLDEMQEVHLFRGEWVVRGWGQNVRSAGYIAQSHALALVFRHGNIMTTGACVHRCVEARLQSPKAAALYGMHLKYRHRPDPTNFDFDSLIFRILTDKAPTPG